MDMTRLKEVLEKEPNYRLQQVRQALFRDLIEDWSLASVLPKTLRGALNEKCPIKINARAFISQDQSTAKALVTLKDGLKIESVLIRHKGGRNTVCLSSQVGCPLGCSFCATGKMGFKRNLEVFEIVEQALFFARYLKKLGERVTNLVFMGMGEPFLNYANVLSAIRVLNDKEGFNLGARRFSISTVGIVEGIEKLTKENLEVNLAIALQAPNDKLRSQIMPVNKKYPMGKIFKSVDNYIAKTRRRVMFEYIMIKDLNDSAQCARKLAGLMKKPLYFVNLISYNPTGVFEPSPVKKIKEFKEILKRKSVPVTQRYRFGPSIKAACGQLAGRG